MLDHAFGTLGLHRIALTVFSGAALPGVPARVRWNLRRDGTLARLVGALVRRDGYFVEQVTFFLSLLPALVLGRPDVVYFADLNLGNLCWHWRRLSGQRFKLLYYNGGLTTRPFTRADVVQQLTPAGFDEAVTDHPVADHEDVDVLGGLVHRRVSHAQTPANRLADGRMYTIQVTTRQTR